MAYDDASQRSAIAAEGDVRTAISDWYGSHPVSEIRAYLTGLPQFLISCS